MHIDIILEGRSSANELAELSQLAESYGMGGVWITNMPDGRDPFVNLVRTAESTNTISMGATALSHYELHPMKMATALLTLNEIAGGRARLGVAAGGGGTPTAMGVPQKRRVRATRECVEILQQACAGKAMKYSGEIYEIQYYDTSWITQPPPLIFVCANGPQMLASAAKYADGIMVGDHHPDHIRSVRKIIDAQLEATGRSKKNFRLNNLWAWHVKADYEDAKREARNWLGVRATPYKDWYLDDVLDAESMKFVQKNIGAFLDAYNNQTGIIEGVPEEIVDGLIEGSTSTAGYENLDKEIERLKDFAAAGLTDIALRLYENPAESIRLIGERVMPEL